MVFTDCRAASSAERLWCSTETGNTSPKLNNPPKPINPHNKLAHKKADLGIPKIGFFFS